MTGPGREQLEQAARRYQRAKKAMEQARADLAPAIVAAYRDGVRQADIARITGLTPEWVRQMLAEAKRADAPTE
jgi:DNA-binding transcriptional regulator LsrR (DeoR family)